MAWRVVIGYDGSDAGEDAVAFGLTWCRSTGDVPVVATVYPEEHPLGAGRVDAEWAAYVRELGQETLDKAQAAAGDAAIYRLVASTSAARGSPTLPRTSMPRRSWSAAAARTKLAAAGSAASPTVCCTEPLCRSAWSPRRGTHPMAV